MLIGLQDISELKTINDIPINLDNCNFKH